MKKNVQQDDISQLLDSIYEDNSLEEKIDAFAKRKENRKSRIVKNKEAEQIVVEQEESSESLGDTKPNIAGNQSGGKTRAFNAKEISNTSNGTVVIDDKKIKSMINKDKGFKLKRKIVSKEEESVGETKVSEVVLEKKVKNETGGSDGSNKRTIAVIVIAMLGLMLAGLVIFGITRTISDFIDRPDSSEVQQQYYEEILQWAEGYNTYSEEEKEKIVDFEKKYNKLTAEQKESINKVLIDQTGSSFDELLAIAKSAEKEDSKNNNTEIAQKKAELKEQINTLKTQLSDAKSALEDAQKVLKDAESDVNDAQGDLDSIQAEIDQYNEVIYRYNDLYSQLELATTDEEKEAIQNSINEMQNDYLTAAAKLEQAQSDLYAAQQNLYTVTDVYSQAELDVSNAQALVDEINMSISTLQAEYDSLK